MALDPLGVAAAVEHGFYVGGAGVDLVINGEREDVTEGVSGKVLGPSPEALRVR